MKKNRVLVGIIIVSILIILFSIVVLVLDKPTNTNKGSKKNNYYFKEEVEELPGTEKYTNGKIKKAHCLDDICVSNVVIYHADTGGRMEYTITNNSSSTASGYLNIVYDNHKFLVVYRDLKSKESINSLSEFKDIKLSEKSDYTLEKLSKEEIKKIIKK